MTDAPTRRSRARARWLGALVAALAATVAWPGVAAAHTDFESSTPDDGAVVDGPLDEIVLRFTNPAEPAGDGFVVLDPTGAVTMPSSVDDTDGTEFVLSFDPPLAAGAYGVRWQVRAGDAHPIDGSFRFEVTVAAAATPASGDAPSTSVLAADTTASAGSAPDAATAAALDELLERTAPADDGSALGRFGRSLTFLGTIFAVGVVAALTWVIRGRRDELTTQLGWVRLAGVAITAGGVVELAALQAVEPTGVAELLGTKAGAAALLKIVGGVAIWSGFHAGAGRIVAPARSVSAAVAFAPTTAGRPELVGEGQHRWTPTAASAFGLAGLAVALASFWFDGHTVSRGPWALHAAANLVHVGAAAVWGGGVFAMTALAWMRRRAAEPTDLAPMVVRFSPLATVSLVAVIGAGAAMAMMIVDGPGDLVGTSWGRVLLAKVAVVAVAAGMGAYNHFRLRPALESGPDDPDTLSRLRRSLSIESAAFVVIVLLTAWLVASAA